MFWDEAVASGGRTFEALARKIEEEGSVAENSSSCHANLTPEPGQGAVRLDLVLRVRQAIANGTYHVPAELVAESIFRHKQRADRAAAALYSA